MDPLFRRFRAAHFNSRFSQGSRRIDAQFDFLLNGSLQIILEFVVEFLLDISLAEKRTQSSDEWLDDRHQISPREAFKIRAMAEIWLSHSRVSVFSFLRPASVSL